MGILAKSVVALALCLSAWDVLASPISDATPLVQTSSGAVRGHNATSRSNVWEFLGIPYGQAPVEKLRFSLPVRAGPSAAVYGDHFAYDCPNSVPSMQNTKFLEPGALNLLERLAGKSNFSEDCLALNVWVKPNLQKEPQAKPVFIWLGMGGDSSNPLYNGQVIADEQDLVVVTVNYRSHIFGFPGAPGTELNLGAADARMAIEWVRDNIKQFGGDPQRMTFAGHSVGADIIEFYSFKWVDNPLVTNYITLSFASRDRLDIYAEKEGAFPAGQREDNDIFSGSFIESSLCGGPTTGASTYASVDMSKKYPCRVKWYKASEKLGCGGEEAGMSTVDCMRTKDFREILAAVPGKAFGAVSNIYVDGDEFGVTVDDTQLSELFGKKSGKKSLLPRISSWTVLPAPITQFLRDATKTGPANTPLTVSYRSACAESFYFSLDSIRAEKLSIPRQDARYYVWNATFPNLQLGGKDAVYHGSDIPVIFGTSETISGRRDEAQEIASGQFLRKLFADFAKGQTNRTDNDVRLLAITKNGNAPDNSGLLEFCDSILPFDFSYGIRDLIWGPEKADNTD